MSTLVNAQQKSATFSAPVAAPKTAREVLGPAAIVPLPEPRITGCGHFLPEECPDELTEAILKFWQSTPR